MGGVFSGPDPAPPPPAPEPAPKAEDPAVAERKARIEAIARRRRGREGTIETSTAGALRKAAPKPSGKSKLGE